MYRSRDYVLIVLGMQGIVWLESVLRTLITQGGISVLELPQTPEIYVQLTSIATVVVPGGTAIVFCLWIQHLRKKKGDEGTGLWEDFGVQWLDIKWGAVGAGIAIAVPLILAGFWLLLWGVPPDTTATMNLEYPSYVLARGICVIFFVPIAMEIFHRGIVFSFLRHKLDNHSAALISAAAFAVVGADSLGQAFAYFIMGYVFGRIYGRTKRLATPVIAHSLYGMAIFAGGFLDAIFS